MTVADNELVELIRQIDVHAGDDPTGFTRMALLMRERRDEFLRALGGTKYMERGLPVNEVGYVFPVEAK